MSKFVFFRENHCETTYQRVNSKFKTREGGKKDGERENADVTRERLPPWLGNTKCIVASREKKISGLVLYLLHK